MNSLEMIDQERMKTNLPGTGTLLALGALLMALNTGCGSTKVETQNSSSVGQQLMDLEKAHNQGIITDKEYEKLKEALVKKHD